MIKLHNLELNNFLSHKSTSLSMDDYEGLILIEGQTHDGHYSSNGSGKSTLLEGIIYALTGDTLRGVSVNDVINRNHKKNTKVSIRFSKRDKTYNVSRYRKDDNHGDSLILSENDENISKRVTKDTQKLLEDLLGISYKVLVSTMLLGEGLSSRFTQLSDPEKKSLVESTLNLNYDINKIRDKANNELKRLRLEAATIAGEIKTLEGLQDSDIELLEDQISDNRKCIIIYEETIRSIEDEYRALVSEIDDINSKIKLINDTMTRVQILSANYQDLANSNSSYSEEKRTVMNSDIPVCKLCHQSLRSQESIQSVLDNYDKVISDNEENMRVISEELSRLPSAQILKSKLEALHQEYTEKMEQSRYKMKSINDYRIMITNSSKDIEQCEYMISAARDCHNKLESKREQESELNKSIEKYDYFVRLFSPTGIIVNILSEAVEYINSRLSAYSGVLLEKDYSINFVKGKLSLVDKKGSNYQSLSNGEKRRLDISIQFALHDYVHNYCGMKMDTLFIDEILDTLDDIGTENIIDVLRMKLDYCSLKSIYVITHNSSLKEKFDRVITVRKNSEGDSFIL